VFLTKADMAHRTRGASSKSSAKPVVTDSEQTTSMPTGKKCPFDSRPPTNHVDLDDNSSYIKGHPVQNRAKKMTMFVGQLMTLLLGPSY